MQNCYPEDLPKWLWLWLPIVVALFPYVMRLIDLETDGFVFGEQGIIENYTFVILFAAIVLGIITILRMKSFGFPVFKYWLMLLVLGCIYYAGEEVSWGQHWFGWVTPESWMDVNDQGETNLHNTSALLDQVPRMLLTIAAVIGGVLIPIYFFMRDKVFSTNEFFGWLWPSYVNIPTCLLAVLVSLHEKAYKLFDTTVPNILDIRAGETKECLLAMFLFMYIASFYTRLKQAV
ncbi:MAG: hypothetical protein R8G33_07850 [Gammaproteobacteria bacterium]|nr:hypothetical protein [Gammaproteobacteria bacterium]